MPTTYTPTATERSDYTVADDDDAPSATVLMTPAEQLADMCAWIHERIADGVGSVTVGDLEVTGGAAVLGTLAVSGGVAVLDADGITTTGDLDVGGDTTLNACTTSGAMICNGSFTAAAGALLDGGVSVVGGALVYGGTGHPRLRTLTGADADSTYGISDADIIKIPALAGNRVYTIENALAGNGDTIEFFVTPGEIDTVELKREDASSITVLSDQSGSGYYRYVKIVRFAGTWQLLAGELAT